MTSIAAIQLVLYASLWPKYLTWAVGAVLLATGAGLLPFRLRRWALGLIALGIVVVVVGFVISPQVLSTCQHLKPGQGCAL